MKETIKVNGKNIKVDQELVFAIYYLNEQGIKTLGCCAGHGKVLEVEE